MPRKFKYTYKRIITEKRQKLIMKETLLHLPGWAAGCVRHLYSFINVIVTSNNTFTWTLYNMHDDASGKWSHAEILKLCSERIFRLFRVCVSMSTAKLLPEFMIAAAHFANIARVMFRRRMIHWSVTQFCSFELPENTWETLANTDSLCKCYPHSSQLHCCDKNTVACSLTAVTQTYSETRARTYCCWPVWV